MYADHSCNRKRKLDFDLLLPKRPKWDDAPVRRDVYEPVDSEALHYQFLATHSSKDLYYRSALRKLIDRRIHFDGGAVARELVDSVGRYGAHPHDLVALDQFVREEIAAKLARFQSELTNSTRGALVVIEDLLRTMPNPRDTLRNLCQSFGCSVLEEHEVKEEEMLETHFDIHTIGCKDPLETPVIDLLTGPTSASNPAPFSAFVDLAQSMDGRLKRCSDHGTVWPLICKVVGENAQNASMPLRSQLDLALRPVILDYPEAFPELHRTLFMGDGGGVRERGVANLNLLMSKKKHPAIRNFSPTPIIDLLIGEHRRLDVDNFKALGYEFMALLRDRFVRSVAMETTVCQGQSGRLYPINPQNDSPMCRALRAVIRGHITEHDRRAEAEAVLRPFVVTHRKLFPELDYFIFPPI